MSARPTRIARTITAVIACVAMAACAKSTSIYSGTLQAESANVGSTVGGRVIDVLTSDGQSVRKGQTLVRFDAKDQRAALAQAQGTLAQAQAALADLIAGPRPQDVQKANAQAAQAQAAYRQADITAPHQITEAAANLNQAKAAAVQAQRDADRIEQLYRGGAVSAQSNDAAVSANHQAHARLVSAQAQYAAARSGTVPENVAAAQQAYEAAAANAALVAAGSRPDAIQQARDAVRSAQAGVAAANARLAEMTVVAPADGIVNSLDLRPGDLVPAGASVASVDEFIDPFVRIYVPQRLLGALQIGQHVDVHSDSLPKRSFDGRIESIDSQAQFTPRDVQTAEDRSNLVFGVKVRVHDPDRVLRGGTTVSVSL
jgi:HlyD family secretion protein